MQGKPQVLQQQLDLEIDGNTVRNGHPLGSITVSTVFRPVDSVSKAGMCLYSVSLQCGYEDSTV